MSNLEYLYTRPGIFKLATIAFGIVCFTLTSFSYADSPYAEFYSNETSKGNAQSLPGTELELYQLIVTGIALGISISYLFIYAFVYELCESYLNRLIDTGYHFGAALFLFAGGCVHFYSAAEIEGHGCEMFSTIPPEGIFSPEVTFCHHFGAKIFGAGLSVINSILYCITGFTVFITKDL